MSRRGYSEDCENNWDLIMYRGAVNSATKGKRGQALLREMLEALDNMPDKKLISGDLISPQGEVCALGAVAAARQLDVSNIDPEEPTQVAHTFNIAKSLAREIVYMNDEYYWGGEAPEDRWKRMRKWVASQITELEDNDLRGYW